MENRKRNVRKKEYLFLYLVSFIITCVFSIKLDTLYASDELGTIANAAALCQITYRGINYYKYGQAILYYPLFKLFDKPNVIYQGAIIINNLLISVIPCCAYAISNSIRGANKCSEKKSFMISIIISLLPSSLLWGRFIWSETTLYLVAWLSMYLLLKNLQAIETQSKKSQLMYNVLLALTIIWGYTAHQRGVVFIFAVLGTWVVFLLSSKKNVLRIPFWIIFFGGIIVDHLFSSYLQVLVYGGNLEISNTTESTVGLLLENINLIFSASGLITMFKLLCGWMFSAICSTYGFFVVGFFVAIFIIALNFKAKCNDALFITALFPTMYFAGALVIGLLFFFPAGYNIFYGDATERLDKIIYARYLSGCFGPFIYLALLDIIYHFGIIKRYYFIIAISTLGMIGLAVFCLGGSLNNGYCSPLQLATFPFLMGTSHGDLLYVDNFMNDLLKCTYFVIVLFMCFSLLIYMEKTKLFALMLSITFMCGSCYTLVNVYHPTTARYRECVRIIDDFLESYNLSGDIQFTSRLPRTNYVYTFAFPNYYVTSPDDGKKCFVIANDNLLQLQNSGYCIIKEWDTKYWGICWVLSKAEQ